MIIDIALIAMVSVLVLLPRSARITIEANTDIVTVDLPDREQGFAWGKLPVDPGSITDVAPRCADPQIDLGQPLMGRVVMEARARRETSDLSVTLRRPDGQDVGILACGDGSRVESGPFVRLVWDRKTGQAITLRFAGYLEAGRPAIDGVVDYLTLSGGKIVTEAYSIPFRTGSVRSETPLYTGDSVRLYRSWDAHAQAIAHGLIRMDADGSLHVVAHAEAREARVIHEGQENESASSVAPSFWAKLQAQSEWTLVVAIVALLLNIVSALRSYRDELALLAEGGR